MAPPGGVPSKVGRRRARLIALAKDGPDLLDDAIPHRVAVLPLGDDVMFPGGVMTLTVSRPRQLALIEDAMADGQLVGAFAQRHPGVQDAEAADLHSVGTLVRIADVTRAAAGTLAVELRGVRRIRVLEHLSGAAYLRARVDALPEPRVQEAKIQKLAMEVRSRGAEVLRLEPEIPAEAHEVVASVRHAGQLADLLAANLDVPMDEKQAVLETGDVAARLALVRGMVSRRRKALASRARPNANLISFALLSVVLGVYLAAGVVPPLAPAGWPLVGAELVALAGTARELWRWLR